MEKVGREHRSKFCGCEAFSASGKRQSPDYAFNVDQITDYPQGTIRAAPFSLMFGQEMRSKLPESRRKTVNHFKEEG